MGKFSKILEKKPVDQEKGLPNSLKVRGEDKTTEVSFAESQKDNSAYQARSSWDERLKLVGGLSNNAAEAFRILRSRILHPHGNKDVPKTIMVTSVNPEEGKTFVASNLAVTLAQGVDQFSMLVDCDLRKPAVARMFGVGNVTGLVNHLEKGDDLGGLIQKSSVDKLSLLVSGLAPSNPSELLGSERMDSLVEELSQRYEDRFIVFDSPPLQIASESLVLSQKVDAVILVVRYGVGNRDEILRGVENIGRERILGVIFNGVETNSIERSLMRYGNYSSRYSVENVPQ